MSDEPRTVEPVPVQLTRIEGTVNLIAYQIGDLGTRMGKVEDRIGAAELSLASSNGSSQSWKTWLPILAALAGVAVAVVAILNGA